MRFSSKLLVLFVFCTFLSTNTVLAVEPDATVDTEMQILDIKEHTRQIKKKVPCQTSSVEPIQELLSALLRNQAGVTSGTRRTDGVCEELVDETSYDVTVGYKHENSVRRKTFYHVRDYPGRVGDKYPVRIEIYVYERDTH